MPVCMRLFIALGLFTSACVANAAIIDTTDQWDGSSDVGRFGHAFGATYGQTFVAPDTVTQLDSWTFYLTGVEDFKPVNFGFYLMAWDGAQQRASGELLFASEFVTTSEYDAQSGFQAFDFDTGGLALNAGKDYIAFISTSLSSTHLSGSAARVANLGAEDGYADGGFFWLNNGSRPERWTNVSWSSRPSHLGDLVFTARFSSAQVSEPGIVGLFLLGIFALFRARRSTKA